MTVFARLISSAALVIAASLASGTALAQRDYARIVVPFPPGGSSDIAARILADGLTKSLGNQFIVENRGGAQGNVGVAAVAKAAPDGQTLSFASASAFTINPSLYQNQGFDPKSDLVPVIAFGTVPIVLTVNPTLPIKTLPEFTKYAKDNPGKLSFSSAGNGSSMHLAGELFQKLSGTKLLHVPYVSGAQAVKDVVGNHVQVVFHLLPAVAPQAKAGSLRALALLAPKRSSTLPDVPTTAEAGMPDLVADAAYFIMVPRGTPQAAISRLNSAINALLQNPAFREQIEKIGITPLGGNPEEVSRLIADETQRWSEFLKAIDKK